MAVAHRQAGSGPVQKREVAVVKQEGGAGPCEGVGTSPVEKVGGKRVSLEEGLGCSLGTQLSGHWKEGCLKGEGRLRDGNTG